MSVVANPLSVTVSCVDGAIVAEIAGELDLATAPAIRDNVRPFTGSGDRVVYQLGGVSFIDSAGIEGLYNTPANGERVVFQDPSFAVRRVLQLLELESSIEDSDSGSNGHDRPG